MDNKVMMMIVQTAHAVGQLIDSMHSSVSCGRQIKKSELALLDMEVKKHMTAIQMSAVSDLSRYMATELARSIEYYKTVSSTGELDEYFVRTLKSQYDSMMIFYEKFIRECSR